MRKENISGPIFFLDVEWRRGICNIAGIDFYQFDSIHLFCIGPLFHSSRGVLGKSAHYRTGVQLIVYQCSQTRRLRHHCCASAGNSRLCRDRSSQVATAARQSPRGDILFLWSWTTLSASARLVPCNVRGVSRREYRCNARRLEHSRAENRNARCLSRVKVSFRCVITRC